MQNRRISQKISSLNKKRIIYKILMESDLSISRSFLSKELDISFPSVSYIVSKLIKERFIVELDKEKTKNGASLGRKPIPMKLNPKYGLTISVQIGYEIAQITAMGINGAVVSKKMITFPRNIKFNDLLGKLSQNILRILNIFEDYQNILTIVFSVPSPIDYEKHEIIYSRFYGWKNIKLPNLLTIGKRKVKVLWENDANLLTYGASKLLGIQNLVGFYLGFGIGSGIVINGKVYRGSQGLAGEIGQLVLINKNPKLRFEEYATEKAFVEMERESEEYHKETYEMPILLEKLEAKSTTPSIKRKMEKVSQDIAIHLAHVIMALDPKRVVFGGEVISYFPSFANLLIKKISEASKRNADTFIITSEKEDFISIGAHWLSVINWFGLDDVENLERSWGV